MGEGGRGTKSWMGEEGHVTGSRAMHKMGCRRLQSSALKGASRAHPGAEYIQARSGEEVPPEDRYSWRKYGQKLIVGAKYPREHYRCACRCLSYREATKMVQRSEAEPLSFEVTYGGSNSCGQENKNQNGERVVLTKETQRDEVGRAAGETPECYTPEMVSTPNTSFNNSSAGVVFSNSNPVFNITNSDLIPTPTSSPYPDTDISLEDDSLTVLFDDVPENARSTYKCNAN
ncbi:putative WRKY transcription factor 41 [Capsicum chinense]|nr:putative WRKY transcription factor 41 [Capsicum chinense]